MSFISLQGQRRQLFFFLQKWTQGSKLLEEDPAKTKIVRLPLRSFAASSTDCLQHAALVQIRDPARKNVYEATIRVRFHLLFADKNI
jgi:hypothetical protein